jgi:CBS domain-containing protein
MTTAREIMTKGATWIDAHDTVAEAAKRFGAEDFGAMPICDGDGHLQGMVTDRDIVLKIVAEGRDPKSTEVGQLVDGSEVVTIGADDDVNEAIRTMKEHSVRRLPVIDGRDLVGMVSQADIARALPDRPVGDLVGAISSAAPNS